MNAMTRNWLRIAMLIVAAAIFLPATLRADTVLTLSSVSGAAGHEVNVFGTISNTGSGVVNLNGEDFNLGSPAFLLGDVLPFFENAPFFLSGGTNSGSIAIFSFLIAPGTASGVYTGNVLDILGGPGIFDQNLIATAKFSVDVTGSAPTPEPGDLGLLLAGMACAFLLLRG
jgi:hypothetical protein